MKIEAIKIIDPDTQEPVSIEEWAKQESPTRAEWVLVETDELRPFCLNKYLLSGGRFMTFGGSLAEDNRLTRAQGLAICDAYDNGLEVAMKLIGGVVVRVPVWTCDATDDLGYTVGLLTGCVRNCDVFDSFQALRVSAFPFDK